MFCCDITYLPTQVRGQHFYLHLFEDLFSREIVGWQVFDCESAELVSQLRQGIAPRQLMVHSDNGAPIRGETMLATMSPTCAAARLIMRSLKSPYSVITQ